MKLFNPKFPGIYAKKGKKLKLYTENLTPGQIFFEEDIIRGKTEYRYFDPRRSKLAAALHKGISQIGIKEDSFILYLGASHGYTCSYLSDILTKKGFIYALDFAPRVLRNLVFVCEKRKNIAPVMADAFQTQEFAYRIATVDIVYQDVAQKNQAEIFIDNCKAFLKDGGFGLLAVKSRSIDITKKPKQVYAEIRKKLENELTVVDYKILDPFEKDHCMFVVKK